MALDGWILSPAAILRVASWTVVPLGHQQLGTFGSKPCQPADLLLLLLLLLLQVVQDASSEGPVENPLLEGGGTPEERQASFLELALCLAAGLPDAALDPLFVVSS